MSESVVDLKHFGPIYENWIRQRLGGTERNVTCREIVADFANVKLVLQCHLDFEPSKGHGAGTSYIRVDPSDPSDQEVRAFEIENMAEDESRNCACSIHLCQTLRFSLWPNAGH